MYETKLVDASSAIVEAGKLLKFFVGIEMQQNTPRSA
jgi:hypothetical protein